MNFPLLNTLFNSDFFRAHRWDDENNEDFMSCQSTDSWTITIMYIAAKFLTKLTGFTPLWKVMVSISFLMHFCAAALV